MRTLILAGSFGEAAKYARGKELRHYRFASSAAAVANFSATRVVQLPGFSRRADQHALKAIARRVTARGGEWIEDEYVPEPEPIDESALGILSRMTRADWLMAGCTPAEADELTPTLTDAQQAEVDRVNAKKPVRRRTRKVATKTDDPFEA